VATLTAALAALDRYGGFPSSRTRQVARRLQEVGALPLGAPGIPPNITDDQFVNLLLAVAVDLTIRETPAAVDALLATTPGGNSPAAPLCISARAALLALVETALLAPGDLDDLKAIEVVANWPEVAIHWGDRVERHISAGSLPGHWPTAGHRKSTTVAGRAFRDAVRAAFRS